MDIISDTIYEEDMGAVKISDEVIAICAVNAALKTEGVAELSGGLTNTLSKNFLGKELLSKGVKISQNDDGVVIDIYVIVKYGVKIPVVAWDIQENVKNEIETMTDRVVNGVNIHVQGVNLSEETEDDEEN